MYFVRFLRRGSRPQTCSRRVTVNHYALIVAREFVVSLNDRGIRLHKKVYARFEYNTVRANLLIVIYFHPYDKSTRENHVSKIAVSGVF